MHFILFLILFYSSDIYAVDCKQHLEYQRNLTKHENDIRLLKIDLREQLLEKCPRSKLGTTFCRNEVKKVEKVLALKDSEFLKIKINETCAKQNKDIVKETRTVYEKTNKAGYFIAGAYRDEGECINSQQAAQACRDVKKVLNSCKLDGNYLLVQCGQRTENNSNNICYEASPILSLLTSPYSVCQVSVKDLEKFAPCLAQSAKDNRQKLCPYGCEKMPKSKMCNWTEDEVNNYLGCLQIATKEQYRKLCPERIVINTPKEATVASKVKGCPNTRYSGNVYSWKHTFPSVWPQATAKMKVIKTSAIPREFVALGFKVNKQDFIKAVAEGDDFADAGESTEQKAYGSGTFFLSEAPGYTGIKEFSLSTCPGMFAEDEVSSNCLKTLKVGEKSTKLYWEVNRKATDACTLDENKLYFLNIRFNRGCNWKSNCAVKIGNKPN